MISKTAMVTICGRPNVGKSTLTNALVGEKIAIVSNKPQTTRNRISAVVNRGDTQFIIIDTPGFHKPKTRLGDYMVNVVKESVADVDAAIDVRSIGGFELAAKQIGGSCGGLAEGLAGRVKDIPFSFNGFLGKHCRGHICASKY